MSAALGREAAAWRWIGLTLIVLTVLLALGGILAGWMALIARSPEDRTRMAISALLARGAVVFCWWA